MIMMLQQNNKITPYFEVVFFAQFATILIDLLIEFSCLRQVKTQVLTRIFPKTASKYQKAKN